MVKNLFVILVVAVVVMAGFALWRFQTGLAPADNRQLRDYVNSMTVTDPKALLGLESGIIKSSMTGLTAVAVGPGDDIFVGGTAGIEIISKQWKHVAGIPVSGTVTCLAVAPDGDVFAGVKDHVEVFGSDRARKAVWARPEVKAELTSIAVSSNFVFACDCVHRIVWRYTCDGQLSGRIGDKDTDRRPIGFVVPSPYFDVAAAADGSIWVTNPGLHRVEHFMADGTFLSSWGEASMSVEGFCGCCNPTHIALMQDGSFVTSEKRIARVKLYDGAGRFKGVVSGREEWPQKSVGLDVAVNSAGRIVVLDPQTDTVRIFGKPL